MKKIPWKHIGVILFLGVGVFIVWEMWKAYQAIKADIAAGEKSIKDVLLAPWNAGKAVGKAISNFFTGKSASAPAVPAVAPLFGSDGQPLTLSTPAAQPIPTNTIVPGYFADVFYGTAS